MCESTKPSSPACTVVPVAATPVRRGLCACVASPEKCVRSTGSDEHWHGGSRAEAVADLGAEAVFGLEVAVQPLRVREESARGTCCAARTVSSVRAAAKATRQRRRELSPFGLLLRAGAPRGPITSARCTVLSERWRVVKQYGLLGVLSFGERWRVAAYCSPCVSCEATTAATISGIGPRSCDRQTQYNMQHAACNAQPWRTSMQQCTAVMAHATHTCHSVCLSRHAHRKLPPRPRSCDQ